MSSELIITAIVIAAGSGIPALFIPRGNAAGQRIAAGLMVLSGFAGLAGAWSGLFDAQPRQFFFPWPAEGNPVMGIDALSSFFLIPIFLAGGLGAVYGLGYWKPRRHQSNGRKLVFFWGLLVAGMALLVCSRHAMGFLLSWEVMAIAAFFLITTEDHCRECRQVGWIYLIATHLGTLALFAMFALWRLGTGSCLLVPVGSNGLTLGMMNGIFVLAVLGFGLKAGLMPLHFWLPGAHANAPSHVSAIMSGIIIKMGIYGLLRVLFLLPSLPAVWGWMILLLGMISGLFGVVFAIAQHDLKRLLAYHSIENIGIILMGLGVGMIGRSSGRPELVVLGLAGCLLHVWNHALFKSLLFLCAGSVIHSTHLRRIDRLGGLAKAMPWTAALFLVGAAAICGLPPLNGFVSEWLVYLGLLQPLTSPGAGGVIAITGVPVLAMIGALAVACFVKVYGIVFLGNARDCYPTELHEAPVSMRVPMFIFAGCCLAIGLLPALLIPVLDAVISGLLPNSHLASTGTAASLKTVSFIAVSLFIGIAVPIIVSASRRHRRPRRVTWDCGYACPTGRMQYTAASFAAAVVAMFGWILKPHKHWPQLQKLFPLPAEMRSHIDDVILDRLILPGTQFIERGLGRVRRLQQGLTQYYILYILLIVILMLSTLVPLDELIMRWSAR